MNHDSALDQLAFAVGYRIMGPDARRALRISLLMEMGEKAPSTPDLATLWDEDRLMRGEREPVSIYDHWTLMRARDEANRPLFEEQFWRLRRADLEGAGFDTKEARDLIASLRASLGETNTIGNEKGDNYEDLEQAV
ncbi:hypothetical protein [Parasphingorhabdus sp.]|uniref:hypothetical protein n=1 Tax=Parasphingorhabdus sp. TaxID=2709688 RepID=UPI003001D1E0